MSAKEDAFHKIQTLVERFDEQKELYKNDHYNETQTRNDFINPFWKALGWDVDNENGYAESYREVVHEDHVKVGGAIKKPDYSFRLSGGKRLFFLEVKRPKVKVKDDIEPAYQIRRYGWNAKLPISVVSDFEEFAIYDCSKKPKPTDKASVARIKYLTYREYLTEFDFLWETFSRECVPRGSFDKFIQGDKNKKGTTTVDRDFLASLDKWRIELARNIALRNDIDEDALNFVVQNTIDRIVFLRIAEDRNVERYGNLQSVLKNGDCYKNLFRCFHVADQKYNSGLFDFQKDAISEKIVVNDKVIKSIISELYYPVCPYEFSVLSVEILGSAYEQFLGKQISLSKGGRAAIEEKPEVRRAGGVYYTPQYIVDYIVENTIGKLLENKTPGEASKMKIVDPACGSGSFLIGAYQYLLNWHKDFYTRNGKPGKGRKSDTLTPTGELTTAEKKRILLNNIYGVDLDGSAVEVTKLSLLLKCMEGETNESIETQQRLFHDRALPNIDANIRCGNSLIDLDYYDDERNFGEERKVKPFSWQKSFPEVFKQGGFDCVIGNPPYGALLTINEKEYLTQKFSEVADFETSQYFISKSKKIVRQDGFVSFIIPNTILLNLFAKSFRRFVHQNFNIRKVADLSNVSVFEQTTVRTIILTLKNCSNENNKIYFENYLSGFLLHRTNTIKQEDIEYWETWDFSAYEYGTLVKKIRKNTIPLSEILEVSQGLIPYDKYRGHDEHTIKNRIWHADFKRDKTYKKELRGGDVKRYSLIWNGKSWISYGNWLAAPRKPEFFKDPRILIREITDRVICATYTDKEYYNNPSIINCIARKETKLSLYFILGIVNSTLLSKYHTIISPKAKKGLFPKILVNDVRNLPFPKNASEKQQAQIIKHVDNLLRLNQELQAASLPHQREQIRSRIDYCEDRINKIVYELYGLTKEEIGLIEGNP
ncbi:MAG: N-6 DNA methylase [Planctomycetaceae bacterium]|nr:N-6 DNA methylase [Planctomycetaceae bacterium]